MAQDTGGDTSRTRRVQEERHVYPAEEEGPPGGEREEMRANEDGVGERVMVLTESDRKPSSDTSVDDREEQQQAESD